MKLIENTYRNKEKAFAVKVITCNKKLATTQDVETGEIVKFNRGKFEWMINKGVFILVEIDR